MLREIQDAYCCGQELQASLPLFSKLSIPFPQWNKTLKVLAYQNRGKFIEALLPSRPILTLLRDKETIPAILRAIREVCQQ